MIHLSSEVPAVVVGDGEGIDMIVPKEFLKQGKELHRQRHVICKGAKEMSEQNVLAEIWR